MQVKLRKYDFVKKSQWYFIFRPNLLFANEEMNHLTNLNPQNEHEVVFSPATDMIEIFFPFQWPVQFTLPSVIWKQTFQEVPTQSLAPIPSTASSSTQMLRGFSWFVF